MVPADVPAMLRERRASGTEICVLLELMRYQGPSGTFSRPRRDVAEALGMTERAVSNVVRSLTRKGVMRVASNGHNGRATVYRLMT